MKTLLATLALSAALLGGCASLDATTQDHAMPIAIEKVPSQWAQIGKVTLTPDSDRLVVRGDVTRRIAGRGPIFGRLQVEVLDAGQHLLRRVDVDYRRNGAHARSAQFVAELAVDPAQVRTVRIVHHFEQRG